MPACKVRIVVDRAASEDPIFTVDVRTSWGSLAVMAEVTLAGRALRLDGMPIGGDASQAQFALRFGLEQATVKNWEQGKSTPNATAMTLIRTIHRHPDAVLDALASGGSISEEAEASSR